MTIFFIFGQTIPNIPDTMSTQETRFSTFHSLLPSLALFHINSWQNKPLYSMTCIEHHFQNKCEKLLVWPKTELSDVGLSTARISYSFKLSFPHSLLTLQNISFHPLVIPLSGTSQQYTTPC